MVFMFFVFQAAQRRTQYAVQMLCVRQERVMLPSIIYVGLGKIRTYVFVLENVFELQEYRHIHTTIIRLWSRFCIEEFFFVKIKENIHKKNIFIYNFIFTLDINVLLSTI